MPSISVGRILDQRYRVLKPLGKGGMSTVFCVEDLQLGKRWAMKVLPLPEDPQSEPWEVQILKCLDHPLAPRLVDRFVWQQQLCIIMDYIEGPTLQQLLDSNGPIDSDTAARWMQDVCSILSHLHENGILYRDVKPANLILSSSGHVKLVDFGYPTLLINGIEKSDPVPFGTRGYAAPEQLKGICDRRSDGYGAGITLYQLLTAESPARKGFRLKPAMMLKPSIPPGMGRILRKATAQKPKDRFSSIDELADAIAGYRKLDEAHVALLQKKLAVSRSLLAAGLALLISGGLLFEVFYLKDHRTYQQLVQGASLMQAPREEDLLAACSLLPARTQAPFALARLYLQRGFSEEDLQTFTLLYDSCRQASLIPGKNQGELALEGALCYLAGGIAAGPDSLPARLLQANYLLQEAATLGNSTQAAALLTLTDCLQNRHSRGLKEAAAALLSGQRTMIGETSDEKLLAEDLLIAACFVQAAEPEEAFTGTYLEELCRALQPSVSQSKANDPAFAQALSQLSDRVFLLQQEAERRLP